MMTLKVRHCGRRNVVENKICHRKILAFIDQFPARVTFNIIRRLSFFSRKQLEISFLVR